MVTQVSFVAFWFAMALFAGATVLYGYLFATKRAAISKFATGATGLGFIALTTSIGMQSVATDGTRLTGENVLILMAWALVGVYFILEHVIKVKTYGALLVPIALVVLLVAQVMGASSAVLEGLSPRQQELLESWRVGIHVALIAFANAGFLVSAAGSLLYLVLERQLKSRKSTRLFNRLPSLAQTDAVARRSVVWAFPVYTAGILLGVLRAVETDVQLWWADARVILSGLVWFAFGAYQFMRWRQGWAGRSAAYIALVGFVLVAILSVIARTVPAGFHVFGL